MAELQCNFAIRCQEAPAKTPLGWNRKLWLIFDFRFETSKSAKRVEVFQETFSDGGSMPPSSTSREISLSLLSVRIFYILELVSNMNLDRR